MGHGLLPNPPPPRYPLRARLPLTRTPPSLPHALYPPAASRTTPSARHPNHATSHCTPHPHTNPYPGNVAILRHVQPHWPPTRHPLHGRRHKEPPEVSLPSGGLRTPRTSATAPPTARPASSTSRGSRPGPEADRPRLPHRTRRAAPSSPRAPRPLRSPAS